MNNPAKTIITIDIKSLEEGITRHITERPEVVSFKFTYFMKAFRFKQETNQRKLDENRSIEPKLHMKTST